MRVPTTEKQSVRPEHTAHSRTHARNSEGVMGWQRPGASLTDTHTPSTHYMVNNDEGNHYHHCQPLTEQNKNQRKVYYLRHFCKIFIWNKQKHGEPGSGESARYEYSKGKKDFLGLSAVLISCQDGTYDISVCSPSPPLTGTQSLSKALPERQKILFYSSRHFSEREVSIYRSGRACRGKGKTNGTCRA